MLEPERPMRGAVTPISSTTVISAYYLDNRFLRGVIARARPQLTVFQAAD